MRFEYYTNAIIVISMILLSRRTKISLRPGRLFSTERRDCNPSKSSLLSAKIGCIRSVKQFSRTRRRNSTKKTSCSRNYFSLIFLLLSNFFFFLSWEFNTFPQAPVFINWERELVIMIIPSLSNISHGIVFKHFVFSKMPDQFQTVTIFHCWAQGISLPSVMVV